MTLLAELRPILIDLSDLSTCATLFQNALQHYQSTYLNPSSADGPTFTLLDVLVLADLYNTLGEHEKAVMTIRRGWRWLQGRGDQRWWDVVEDDREFDVLVGPGSGVTREGDVASGGYELDVNARQRLAVARIKMGEVEEARVGFIHLCSC
jgi:general transcription factor 3C polypeptide 3 (transcription factor C subunit 4)